MTFKHKIDKISVIEVNDMYLANLFGMCDGEEIFLEDDMNDYILDEIEDGNIEGKETIKDIEKLQEIIRKELETSIKVKVEYNRRI